MLSKKLVTGDDGITSRRSRALKIVSKPVCQIVRLRSKSLIPIRGPSSLPTTPTVLFNRTV